MNPAAPPPPLPLPQPNLRRGSNGRAVGELQRLLNARLGAGTLSVDEDFGQATEDAVSLFQYLTGMLITGRVTAAEWRALSPGSGGGIAACFAGPVGSWFPCAASYVSEPQQSLPAIAIPYLGATEAAGNRMGSDPRMREIFENDGHTEGLATSDGYPWCAAFVSLCVQKLLTANSQLYDVTPPREASVNHFLTSWAVQEHCLIFRPTSTVIAPAAGDLVVYTFSHIGIVERAHGSGIETIEGNTNEEGSREGTAVLRKTRSKTLVRRFIRLPVRRGRVVS